MRPHSSRVIRTILIGGAACCGLGLSAGAQSAPPPPSPWTKPTTPNTVAVSLVAQDQSDCTNSTVKDDPNRTRGGEITVMRQNNGTTKVQVGMTVSPNTTYHFFLKCVRQLGDIRTDEDGIGLASFSFPTSSVGSNFAFDMYPEGAPSGNKFQSVTVTFN